MIYIDTSVVLAHLFAEDRRPPDSLWTEVLVSSRLLQYETWTRVHALGRTVSHASFVADTLSRLAWLELVPMVLGRALEPFPEPVRTLDALHLASAIYLVGQGQPVRLASYDDRMLSAAKRLGLRAYSP